MLAMTDDVLATMFPNFDAYERFALDHVGVISTITIEKKDSRYLVTGTIEHDGETLPFRRAVVRKWEYVEGHGPLLVPDRRRLKENMPVMFNVNHNGKVSSVVVYIESELNKVDREDLRNEAFTHRFVRETTIRNRRGVKDRHSEVVWEGTDLNALREERPKDDPNWFIIRGRFRYPTREQVAQFELGPTCVDTIADEYLTNSERDELFPYMVSYAPSEKNDFIAVRTDDRILLISADSESDTYRIVDPKSSNIGKEVYSLSELKSEASLSWYVHKFPNRSVKLSVTQTFQYYDPFTHEWVDCLDPR